MDTNSKPVYKNSALETLGYPIGLHAPMYAIRRKQAEDVTTMLIEMMKEGAPPPHAVRLAQGTSYAILPTNKGMEIYGGVRNLPIFIEMAGEDTALVNFVQGDVLLSWKVGDDVHWFMVAPSPEVLREDADQLLDKEEDITEIFKLADWIDRIPNSSAAGPDA